MSIRHNRTKRLMLAGALMGALAAFVVGMAGQLILWLNSNQVIISTGATQGTDMYTYFSLCHAVWRSPNGLTYTYPYDLYWPVPAIAFQLPITALAWVGRLVGLPAAFEIGRIAGAAGAGASLGAIASLFPRGFWRIWFLISAVLGGGLFGVAAIFLALKTAGLPGLTEPHQYIRMAEGITLWWLPYLAENLRMPLECIYHAFVISGLACLALRRWWWAWFFGLLTWMSNPFAAVALHAAAIPWLVWRVLETRSVARRRYSLQLIAWLAVNLAAVLYYGWFLNQWPLMRELNRLYRIQYVPALEWWRLALLTMPYALGLLGTLVMPAWRKAIWGKPTWRLFAILAVAHLALLQQSAILGERSMQSYHYNRGYLHLALVLVFWRVSILLAHQLRSFKPLAHLRPALKVWQYQPCRNQIFAITLSSIVAITCLDQLLFAAFSLFQAPAGMVSASYVRLLDKIPPTPAPMLVSTEPFIVPGSYVAASTPHIAYEAGETMVVPFPELRASWLEAAYKQPDLNVADLGIDYAILSTESKEKIAALQEEGWKHSATDGPFILYRAPNPQPAPEFSPRFALSSHE